VSTFKNTQEPTQPNSWDGWCRTRGKELNLASNDFSERGTLIERQTRFNVGIDARGERHDRGRNPRVIRDGLSLCQTHNIGVDIPIKDQSSLGAVMCPLQDICLRRVLVSTGKRSDETTAPAQQLFEFESFCSPNGFE
jgi:hypothetical protein